MYDSIINVSGEVIDQLYANEVISLRDLGSLLDVDTFKLPVNSYLCCRWESKSSILWIRSNDAMVVHPRSENKDFKPRNLEQSFLWHALTEPSIKMVTVTGPAGTGKTLVVLAATLIDQMRNKKKFKKLVLTKPRTQVTDGDEPMGEVPGSALEKMAPQMMSYNAAINKLLGGQGQAYIEAMIRAGGIEIVPLEHMRGLDFDSSLVICDEAQNLGYSQYKMLSTRINANSKLILMGDVDQNDKYQDKTPALLEVTEHRLYQSSPLTSHIHLVEIERSPLTALMLKIMP